MTRERKEKWIVYGEFGGSFTNLVDAKECAKQYSISEPDEEISILLIEDGCYYIDYLNGKCVRDGWSRTKNK